MSLVCSLCSTNSLSEDTLTDTLPYYRRPTPFLTQSHCPTSPIAPPIYRALHSTDTTTAFTLRMVLCKIARVNPAKTAEELGPL